jgi:threonylcarbamoyladenosine tRNA methylthiotransferase MtaB
MKFRIHTMGCRVNQAESADIAAGLAAAGHEPCGADGIPGLVILNTCCVTASAEKEAFRMLRRLRRECPGARVIAAGCLAQLAAGRLLEGGLADLALGNSWKGGVADALARPDGTALVDGGAAGPFPEAAAGAPAPLRGRTRAVLKIQDGCSRGCAYCVIPAVRGRPRSLPPGRVLARLRAAMEGGAAEAVLTGIHLGAWGEDLGAGACLAGLLESVADGLRPDPARFRLRLSSLEPQEALPLLPAFERMPFLAPHLHLPLQAGSDRILRAMGRRYAAAGFREAAEAFAARIPGVSLGADVVAGFPGETSEDFEEGLGLLRSLPLSYLHVFPFSVRPGTRAAAMGGRVPPGALKERVAELKRLDGAMRARFLEASLGREHLAVAENSLHRGSGRRRALTGNYLNALLPEGCPAAPGRLLRVSLSAPRNPWGLPEAEPCP